MSEKKIKILQDALDQKQNELSLITAIDEIRDTKSDPAEMLTAIVNLLADRLEADLCLLFLLDRETRNVALKAVNDHGQELGQLEQVLISQLAERAVQLDHITPWQGGEVLPVDSLTNAPETLHLVGVPIIMGTEERLGALILSRSQVPFGPNDLQLLETAEDHIDSAVIQGQIYHRHQLTANELETIYQVDRIRDQSPSLDEMLDDVLRKLNAAIEAEMSFFMRYDMSEKKLDMQAATHKDLLWRSPYYKVIEQVAHESLQQAELVWRADLDGVLHSLMCLPLILNEYIIGVLGVARYQEKRGFTSADCRLLRAIGSQIDTAIYEGLEQHRLRLLLSRSVGTRVMEQLLAHPNVDILRGERKVLTVLYGDIRGSTDLAEDTRADLLVGFINDYLSQMTDVILEHEGTLDKFVGDEVMALFGAPIPQEDHAMRAVRCGLVMQAAHQEVMTRWQERGIEARPMGIGIATGELTVGEMGSSRRANYSVIGRAANLGARICSVAEGGQVLVSRNTYDLVKGAVEAVPLPGQQFKGLAENVTIYDIKRLVD